MFIIINALNKSPAIEQAAIIIFLIELSRTKNNNIYILITSR